MVTKIRSFFSHIGVAFKSLRRNGWMTLAAVSAVAITLLLVGSLIATLFNINKLAYDVEEDVSIRVSIDLAANEEDQRDLADEIMTIDGVEDIEHSSQDEELDNIVNIYGSNFEMFEGDDNPLYDVLIVHANSPQATQQVAEQIEEYNYVQSVNYGGAEADRLFDLTQSIRNVGFFVVGILILAAIFLISNTIRIAIFSRSTEIEIMKLVGAKNWFIRWPFLIEGATIGLLGSLIAASIIGYVYVNGFQRMMNFLSSTNFTLLSPNPFLYKLLGMMVALGVIIGSFGSSLSIRKFLKI